MDCLIPTTNNFKKGLPHEPTSVDLLKTHMNTSYERLEALRHSFGGNFGLINKSEGLRALFTQGSGLQAKYFVDLAPSKASNQQLELAYLAEQIRHIQK